jgi:hypothetical protein
MIKKIPNISYGLFLFYFLIPSFNLLAAGPPPVTSTTLKNPLAINTIEELLVAILNILIIIAIPIVVFFIIYSGFLYVTARGNAQQVEQATRSLTYAIIGGVLIIGAVAIAEIVKNLVQSF